MNKEKLNKLENEIEEKSFYLSNKDKNSIWNIMGILFQCLNVIICFFGLYLFLFRVIDDFIFKQYIIGGISLAILIVWERLKRLQIRNSSMQFFKEENRITNKNIVNFSLTLFLIICSSLIAIKGGIELSDKKENIVINTDSKIKSIKDSISSLNNIEIKEYKERIDFIYTNSKLKNDDSRALTRIEQTTVDELDNKILLLKSNRDSLINQEVSKIETNQVDNDSKNSSIIKIFVISSLIFEIFILLSIYYCSNFDYKSYYEIIEDKKYRQKSLYIQYLDILYENNTLTKDDKVMAEKRFNDIIKIKLTKTVNTKEFLSVISFLKITITKRDKRKYFNKNYKESVSIIEEYFKK